MAFSRWLAATIVLALLATPVAAQLTKEERVCQQAAAKQSSTFLGKKIKCLVACDKQVLNGRWRPLIACHRSGAPRSNGGDEGVLAGEEALHGKHQGPIGA